MAEGSANIWGIQLSGKDRRRAPFVYTFFGSGGTGARPTKDGLSATAFPSGVLGTPVEVVETLAPLLVERKALRDGSGGGGYGPPAERDPALRARDRLEGYLTPQRAPGSLSAGMPKRALVLPTLGPARRGACR